MGLGSQIPAAVPAPNRATLGSVPLQTRVRVGRHIGIVVDHLGAVVNLQIIEPERIYSAWFLPTCEAEILPDTAEADA